MRIHAGRKQADVGVVEDYCDRCKKSQKHLVVVDYGITGLAYHFNMVMEKKYFLICSKCKAENPADYVTIENEFPNFRLPFMDRFGCLAVIVGVPFVAIVIAIIRFRNQ